MAHLSDTSQSPSGHEPALSDGRHSGAEPMLGGERRAGAALQHLRALLQADSPTQRQRVLQTIRDYGQAPVYAEELARLIPAHTRHQVGRWHGTLAPSQRLHAIEALEHIGGPESIEPLLDVLADSTYRQIQRAAAHTLTTICGRLSPDDPQTADAYYTLTTGLANLPLRGRNVVIDILSAAPQPDLALRPILKTGLTAPQPNVRREAARALGMLGDPRATKRLVFLLTDDSGMVRASAAWALGQLEAPICIPALINATLDSDEVVRAAAVTALGAQVGRLEMDDDDFRPGFNTVVEKLSDKETSVRYAALTALVDMDRPAAKKALRQFQRKG